jgi:hypothetical protein
MCSRNPCVGIESPREQERYRAQAITLLYTSVDAVLWTQRPSQKSRTEDHRGYSTNLTAKIYRFRFDFSGQLSSDGRMFAFTDSGRLTKINHTMIASS